MGARLWSRGHGFKSRVWCAYHQLFLAISLYIWYNAYNIWYHKHQNGLSVWTLGESREVTGSNPCVVVVSVSPSLPLYPILSVALSIYIYNIRDAGQRERDATTCSAQWEQTYWGRWVDKMEPLHYLKLTWFSWYSYQLSHVRFR